MNYKEICETTKEMQRVYKEVEESTPYTKLKNKMNKLYEQKHILEKKINTLENKLDVAREKCYKKLKKFPLGYAYDKIKLIAEEILNKHDNFYSYEVVGPFGLNCETSIWFLDKEYTDKRNAATTKTKLYELKQNTIPHIVASVTFHKDLFVCTGEKVNNCEEGSIGWLNGDNKVTEEVTSIEQVESYLSYKEK